MKTKVEKIFTQGADCFTQLDLFREAAALKGLELKDNHNYSCDSRNIKEFFLTEDLLAKLAERGIKKNNQPAKGQSQFSADCLFVLEDENFRTYGLPDGLPEYQTNRWEFRRAVGEQFDLRIFLSVGFKRHEVNHEVIGISLHPQANGTYSSASDKRAHFHLFRILVEDWAEAPAIAKELAASHGTIHLAWADLGLEGLRFRSDFFRDFTGGNEEIFKLNKNKIFSPAPFPLRPEEGEILYDVKAVQRYLARRWREQLREYRHSLMLKRRKTPLV